MRAGTVLVDRLFHITVPYCKVPQYGTTRISSNVVSGFSYSIVVLAVPVSQINGIGISTGTERLAHFLPNCNTATGVSTGVARAILIIIFFFLFFQVIRLYFYPVDLRSKYNMVKTGRVQNSWSKWEDERLPGLRGLERAPCLAGVKRRTSRPHRRAHQSLIPIPETYYRACPPFCRNSQTFYSVIYQR